MPFFITLTIILGSILLIRSTKCAFVSTVSNSNADFFTNTNYNEFRSSSSSCSCFSRQILGAVPNLVCNPDPVGPRVVQEGVGTFSQDVLNSGPRIVNEPPPDFKICQGDQVWCCITIFNPAPVSLPPRFKCGEFQKFPVPKYGKSLDYAEAEFGQYPWTALIMINYDKHLFSNEHIVGSGVLIDESHVITAAHKVFNFQKTRLKVRLGEWDLNSIDVEPFPIQEIAVSVRIHPEYNYITLVNDIAILKLEVPVNFSYPHINPACLPNPDINVYSENSRCWVAGFGSKSFKQDTFPNLLRQVDLPLIDSRKCEELLQSKIVLGSSFKLNKHSFLCAGGEPGKDACFGDGGAGLVCLNPKTNVFDVVGLVAWGIGCGKKDIPGVYVHIANYIDWIAQSKLVM